MKKSRKTKSLNKTTLEITYPTTMTKDQALTHIKAALNMWQVKELHAELGIMIKA